MPAASSVPVPAIAEFVKAARLRSAIEEREIVTNADLEDGKRYSYYTAMLVNAGLARTREVLTDYRLYAEMVPYVDRALYNAKTGILDLEGGIWKFRLASSIRFEEKSDRWIQYRIVAGHFAGLTGDILFESRGEKGTLVMMRGALEAEQWPPAFVIEQGAQIVFGFTAKRMRSYLEKK